MLKSLLYSGSRKLPSYSSTAFRLPAGSPLRRHTDDPIDMMLPLSSMYTHRYCAGRFRFKLAICPSKVCTGTESSSGYQYLLSVGFLQ